MGFFFFFFFFFCLLFLLFGARSPTGLDWLDDIKEHSFFSLYKGERWSSTSSRTDDFLIYFSSLSKCLYGVLRQGGKLGGRPFYVSMIWRGDGHERRREALEE
ncbi:uncharacterized protein K452DRAFT_169339 [Aplosporella prunicola CBS 121167]|uniref:Secreted protein n=1 Tax=Aplosporella prunicola CBS 121167 TaxID=1176127 RepID=A0A6A6BI98_9PEZI|nr:uncharacterized protein K452DRAFT_169339 [Aplosporella prunicola CBS 121167]KAF2143338.1 hypothetical protein K452DRAFT_169339 [Aplosporella prunicola CBS 121167]